MMGRILGMHSKVYMFRELHFFDELLDPADSKQLVNRADAIQLVATLLSIQREGYGAPRQIGHYSPEAEDVIANLEDADLIPGRLLRIFLMYEVDRVGAEIPCEQTPRNLVYADNILELYPDAQVIEMIRDPRDVLLSQKNRWRRRFMGRKKHTRITSLRAWANYHSLTTSKIWTRSIRKGKQLSGNPRVTRMRYEDLVTQPDAQVRSLCGACGLEFEPGMLDIPLVGSSTAPDSGELKISAQSVGRWKAGGLTQTEIWLCQRVARKQMDELGYKIEKVSLPFLGLLLALITFPIKLFLALFLNLHRRASLRAFITRRR